MEHHACEKQIRTKPRELSEGLISYATALSVSHDLRQLVGNIDVMPDGCHYKSMADLQNLLVDRATFEASRIGDALDRDFVRARTEEKFKGAR